jgi:hypothetical protein
MMNGGARAIEPLRERSPSSVAGRPMDMLQSAGKEDCDSEHSSSKSSLRTDIAAAIAAAVDEDGRVPGSELPQAPPSQDGGGLPA